MERITDKMTLEEVNGANKGLFRIVTLEDEDDVWTVVDKFGNIVSPFLHGAKNVVPFSRTNCVVVGKDNKGNSRAFNAYCSGIDPDDSKYKRIQFPYPITYVSYIDHETLLFGTSQGLCFVDSRTFRQKSDFYDALFYNGDAKVKSWVYKKDISNDHLETSLTGTITLDGQVGERAYDSFFHKVREICTSKVSESRYDVIETSPIIEELDARVLDDSIRVRNGLKRCLINKK
jgi:hypothetical protein